MITFLHPYDVWYALVIVFLAVFTIPFLICSQILRIGRRKRKQRFLTKFGLSLLLMFVCAVAHDNSFGTMICFWLFFPLDIILALIMDYGWNKPDLFTYLAVPIAAWLYFYLYLSIIFLFDRKIFWKWSRKGKRLQRRISYRSKNR